MNNLTPAAQGVERAFAKLASAYARGQQTSKHRVGTWRSSVVLATKTHPKLVRARNRRRNRAARRSRRINRSS